MAERSAANLADKCDDARRLLVQSNALALSLEFPVFDFEGRNSGERATVRCCRCQSCGGEVTIEICGQLQRWTGGRSPSAFVDPDEDE